MGNYNGECSFIAAYRKDAALLLYGTSHVITADGFLRLVRTLGTRTTLIAEGEKAIIDHEEYNEMLEKGQLESLKEFFRKHKGDGIGFMKLRIDENDAVVSDLYDAFKETGRFIEYKGQEEGNETA